MDDMIRRLLAQSFEQENKQRQAWNTSMWRTLHMCGPTAKSFIRSTVERNSSIISDNAKELRRMSQQGG